MAAFSTSMRNLATSLINQFGSDCILTNVTRGAYNPVTGNTPEIRQDYPMKYAQSSKFNSSFPMDGTNTNLDAFSTESMVIAWFGKEISTSGWEFNGNPINNILPTTTQNDIVIYNLTVGEKK